MTAECEVRPPIIWTLEDEREYRRARRDLHAAWKADILRRLALTEPKQSTAPGPLDPKPLPVVPSPSSKQPRYARGTTTRQQVQARYRAKLAARPCSVPGCTSGQHAGGMCGAHQMQARRGTLVLA